MGSRSDTGWSGRREPKQECSRWATPTLLFRRYVRSNVKHF